MRVSIQQIKDELMRHVNELFTFTINKDDEK
jgi:hypothetical protein